MKADLEMVWVDWYEVVASWLRRRGCGAHGEGGGIPSWAVQVQTTAVMICRLGFDWVVSLLGVGKVATGFLCGW